jgi:molybdopterin-guanine dinucleotide biosynthesis protein A
VAEHQPHITPAQITGLILAGGRGTRMGTVDKGLQAFRGQPMVQHALARLAPQVDRVIINANQNLERYEEFGIPVWPDQITGYAGPLAGLHAGLSHCETDYLLTVPCDAPLLPDNLALKLGNALQADYAEIAMVVTGDEKNPEHQPVFCLMKKSVLPSLSNYLQQGGRKVDAWAAMQKYITVYFADAAAFTNINTKEQLQQLDIN